MKVTIELRGMPGSSLIVALVSRADGVVLMRVEGPWSTVIAALSDYVQTMHGWQ